MVKRSTKSKSKRTSIRKKHETADKVRAHNRKQRRQQRKKAKENKAKGIRPSLSDPGVPASWPMREEFLKEMGFERDRILSQKKLKKQLKQAATKTEQKASSEATGDVEMVPELEQFAQEAQKRGASYQEVSQTTPEAIPQSEDVGGREYFKDFRKVVALADVVLQVLDVRDPEGCRSEEVEALVRQFTPQKRLVFLLNKIGHSLHSRSFQQHLLGVDLVPREAVESWLKYLRQFAPTIAFRCSVQRQNENLGQSKNRTLESKSSVCLGADNLIQLLKNYTRNADIKTAITVGLVGVPNVGKSSVINSLKRSRAVHVGNRPGVTTHIQEVHLDKQIRLLDSPGVIYEKTQGKLPGVVKAESLVDPIGMVEIIAAKLQPEMLKELYKIEDFTDVQSLLSLIAKKTGKLKKGGVPDIESAAKALIQDWNNGKIPFYTLPPSQPATEVQVVDQWGPEFTLEGMNDAVLEQLQEEETPDTEMKFQPEQTHLGVSAAALEAFGRMGQIQETRAHVKEAATALTDLNFAEEQDKPESSPPEGKPTVQVLYRKGDSSRKKNRAKRGGGPVGDSAFNLVKPNSNQRKIKKKKARKLKNKVQREGTVDACEGCIRLRERRPYGRQVFQESRREGGFYRVASDGSSFLTGRPLVSICRQEPTHSRSTLSVVASKKKGKKLMRQGMGGSAARRMQSAAPPKVPELPIDPENEEFIMFMPRWMPVTVMKGGWSANALAKAQGSKWGKNLYGETLVKNIGQAFYRESAQLERSIRQNVPLLKHANALEYGFKIRDKTKPNDWMKQEGIQALPPRGEVESGGLIDNVKDLFAGKKKLF